LSNFSFPNLQWKAAEPGVPSVYRATLNINEVADTFLLSLDLGQGIAFVNGHFLGQYWNIGPEVTVYIRQQLLKKGNNEIVLVESSGLPAVPRLAFLNYPILDISKARVKGVPGALTARDSQNEVWSYISGPGEFTPAQGWNTSLDFSETGWSKGAAPFGVNGKIRGEGKGKIYLRRVATLQISEIGKIVALAKHSSGCTLYINGV
jgi:hypothetical protein